MIIDNKTVINQGWWDKQAPDVKAAMKKAGVVIVPDVVWDEAGRIFKQKAEKLKLSLKTK